MLKKLSVLFMTVIAIFSLSLTVAYASDIIASGECGENATWTLDSDGLLTISGTGEIYKSNSPLWRYTEPVKIVVEEGITSIGASLFSGCKNVTEIQLPDSLTDIEYYAFHFCEKLENFTIPKNVVHVGREAFHETAWFKNQPDGVVYKDHILYKFKHSGDALEYFKVEVPEGITTVADQAFGYFRGYFDIVFPDTLTHIGNQAFYGCVNLGHVTLHEGVVEINNNAFNACNSLEQVYIPESLEKIGDYAFADCDKFEKIAFGNKVKSIGKAAFYSCDNLCDISLPKDITTLYEYTFSFCSRLKKIVIPENVEIIESGVFESCESLETIEFPESLWYINASALEGTLWYESKPDGFVYAGNVLYKYKGVVPKNDEFVIPYGTTAIAPRAFVDENSKNLKNLVIPDTVRVICGKAFAGCQNLETVTLPAGVVFAYYEPRFCIDYWGAFDRCINLKDIYYGGSLEQWDTIQMEYLSKDVKIHSTSGYKYYTNTAKIDNENNVIVADKEYVGKNVMCVFVKNNEVSKISKNAFKNGKAEFKMDDKYDEVRIYVYDKLTSPKFDFYEKIKL